MYKTVLRATLLTFSVVGCGMAWAADSFTASYQASSGRTASCSSSYDITGREPTTSGTYPVFVYMVGTSENYTNGTAMAAIERMAEKGYVAATVDYANGTFGSCSVISRKARCVFDPQEASSAINALCSRAKADCGKGIVVAGFSQGSITSILARDYNTDVRAAYGLGAGVQYSSYDLRSCVADGNRTLPSDRLRAVNGEADGFMGGDADSVRAQLQELNGLTGSTGAYAASRSNGSGWQMVRHSELSDGYADHCYMRVGGCTASQDSLDAGFEHGSDSWALEHNLNWLTKFTTQ